MEDKVALNVLIKMIEKYPFTEEEKEAIKHTLGLLSWTSLKDAAIKRMREKRIEKRRKAVTR